MNADGTVDVEYAPPYTDVEKALPPARIRSIGKRSLPKARAMRALRQAPRNDLVKYVTRDIGPQAHYHVRSRRGKRLLYYTHEEVMGMMGSDRKRLRTGKGPAPEEDQRPEPYDPDKRPPRARKRKSEESNEELRPALRKRKADKDEQDDQRQERSVKFICLDCKEKGRRFNHPPDNCNYAKGGALYGLKGVELEKTKDAFFDKLNQGVMKA